LRSRRLEGFKFRRQVPMCGYILDFYCIRIRLAVELDGGQHADADAIAYDQRRAQRLEQESVRILRFWDDDVLKHTDAVAEAIHDACRANPHPDPLPDYREREYMHKSMSESHNYFDLQVNGYGGVDFNQDDLTEEHLHTACTKL